MMTPRNAKIAKLYHSLYNNQTFLALALDKSRRSRNNRLNVPCWGEVAKVHRAAMIENVLALRDLGIDPIGFEEVRAAHRGRVRGSTHRSSNR